MSVAVIITIGSFKTVKKTEENLIEQSEGVVNELGHSIDYFLSQYEGSIQLLLDSSVVIEYASVLGETEGNNEVQKELDHFFNSYFDTFGKSSSVYLSLANNHTKIVPAADLTGLDVTTRKWYQQAIGETGAVHWSQPLMRYG